MLFRSRSKDFIEAFHILESAQWSDAELDAYRVEEHAIGTSRRQQTGAREEGVEEGQKKVARNMLRKKIDIKLIAECTDLSLEEIRKLKKT